MTTSLRSQTARILLGAAAVLLATFATTLHAQTSFSAGGVEVRAFLSRSATDVYAAAYGGGLYRSTDAGANWVRINLPANERYLTSIAGNTSATMVVGGEEGLLRSTDGTTFTRTLHEPVSAVAMGNGASTTVLAAVKGVGIFRSTDGGATFTLANNAGFSNALDITALAEQPSPLAATTFYAAAKPDGAGNRGGVFRSTDGGATWAATAAIEVINGPNQVWSLAVDTSGNLHAAVVTPQNGGGRVYRSTNGGASWDTAAGNPNNTFGNVSVNRDANVGTSIWSGARYLGVLRSDGGGVYNYLHPCCGGPRLLFTSVNAVATMPGNPAIAMMAIKGAGVWRSTVAAIPRNWTRIFFPGADRVLSASNVPGSANSMMLGLHAGGVWRSDAAGNLTSTFYPPTVDTPLNRADFSYATSETQVNPFASIWQLAATTGGQVYATAGNVSMHYGNDPPGLYRWNGALWQGIGSANTGPPWNIVAEAGQALQTGSEAVYGVSINAGDDTVVYASYLGASKGILRRESGGGSWTLRAVPGVTPQVRATVPSTTLASRILALPFDDKPAVSTDFGANFSQQISASQHGFERLRFFAAAENPTDGTKWVGATNKGIYRSTDSAVTWTRVVAGFPMQAATAVGYKSTGRVFAADMGGNRYCSADNGANWVLMAGGPFRAGVNAIKVFGGQLYYLTDGAGAYREDGSC